MAAQDFIPHQVRGQVPALYATEHDPDPTVWVKLFTPDSSWAWYLTEYSPVAPDGTPELAFGLAVGSVPELGYINLAELAAVRGPYGLPVERDRWWQPCPLSAVRAGTVR